MAKFDTGTLAVVAVVILGFLAITGTQLPGFEGAPTGEVVTPTGFVTAPQPVAQVGVQQTVTDSIVSLKPFDKFAPGPVIDIECVLSKNGDLVFDSGSVSTATATRSPGEILLLACWDDGQTTDISGTSITIDTSNDWYGYKEQITLLFNGFPKGNPVWPSDFQTNYIGSYKEANFDSNFITNPDGTLNSATTLSVGADGDKSVTLTLSGPAKKSFGDPYAANDGVGMVISFDYNTSTWGLVEVTEASTTGGNPTRIGEVDCNEPIPGFRLGTDDKACRLPYAGLTQGEEIQVKIHFVTKSGVDPIAGQAEDINFFVHDTCLYFDEEGSGFKYAIEDEEDDTDCGLASGLVSIDIN